MARMNPAEVAAKWANRTSGATAEYKAGVQAVKQAPGVAAAAAVDRMIARLQELRDSGKLAQRMQSVSLSEWQAAALGKGADRLASGARAAQPKMQQFMSEFLPFVEGVANSLPARGDFSQNMQRMIANAEAIHQFKRR